MDWRGQAMAFYERACGAGLQAHPQVLAFVENAVWGDGQWGIACSGGADSLALLLWLYGATQAGVLGGAKHGGMAVPRFTVLHLDHNLRGVDSAGDAVFVAQVAAALGWPLYAEQLPAQAGDTKAGDAKADGAVQAGVEQAAYPLGVTGSSEEALRRARQAFFARSGCTVIFQGHHLGDVAETLLMRIATGSGLEGLAAPRPVSCAGAAQPVYLRPLLDWKKAQIVGLLTASGIRWREDASNTQGVYFRNRVRLNVLPALEQAAQGRDVFAAAGLSRTRLQEDAQALEAWLDAVWQKALLTDAPLPATAIQENVRLNPAAGDGQTEPMVEKDRPAGDRTADNGQEDTQTLVLDWQLFAPLPRAIRRRALWRLLGHHDLAAVLSGAALETMLDGLEAARQTLSLSAGKQHFLRYEPSSGRLAVVNAAGIVAAGGGPLAAHLQASLLLAAGENVRLPCGGQVRAQWVKLDEALRQRIRSGKILCEREVYLALPPAAGAGVLPAESPTLPSTTGADASPAGSPALPSTTGADAPPAGSPALPSATGADASPAGSPALPPATGADASPPELLAESPALPSVSPSAAPIGAEVWGERPAQTPALPRLLRVRFWQAGDRYRPLGAPGRRKVQDVFTDKKIPARLRAGLPVVVDAQSGAVLWVAGLPPAHECAVEVSTKWALWLTYTPACKKLAPPFISNERRTTTD